MSTIIIITIFIIIIIITFAQWFVFVHAYILMKIFIKYSEDYSTVDKVGSETF